MKAILTTLCSIAAINFSGTDLRAEISDVEIHCIPKKVDASGNQNSASGSIMRAKERWSYDVTIENKTFKDLSGLEMKYVIFFKQEKLGARFVFNNPNQTSACGCGESVQITPAQGAQWSSDLKKSLPNTFYNNGKNYQAGPTINIAFKPKFFDFNLELSDHSLEVVWKVAVFDHVAP